MGVAAARASILKVPSPVFLHFLRSLALKGLHPFSHANPNRRGTKGEEEYLNFPSWRMVGGGGGISHYSPFPVILKCQQPCPCCSSLSLWRPCLHLSFPGPPRELGKAKSAGSVPLVFPLSGPAPLPELPLLCMAERLVPLDVRCKLDALEEKELISPRSPEEPPVCEGETSVSHS